MFSGQRSLNSKFLSGLVPLKNDFLDRLCSGDTQSIVSEVIDLYSGDHSVTHSNANRTQNIQMAIFLKDLALFESLWNMNRFRSVIENSPNTVFFGNSIGEVTALVAAGFLDFDSGAQVVALRARLIQAHFDRIEGDSHQPAMALVKRRTPGFDQRFWENLASQFKCEISANLSDSEKVYSGNMRDLLEVLVKSNKS